MFLMNTTTKALLPGSRRTISFSRDRGGSRDGDWERAVPPGSMGVGVGAHEQSRDWRSGAFGDVTQARHMTSRGVVRPRVV